MNFTGYTTLMAPEAMRLSYLETLLSWSKVCKSISICYSKFPKLDFKIPEGAVEPWIDDNSLDILRQFDKDVLGGKLDIIEHNWDPDEPREDGFTKQIAREAALRKLDGDIAGGWAFQFDADEMLRDGDEHRLMQECLDDNEKPLGQRKPFAVAGILELFGGDDAVRFGFGNWVKIRATRNIPEIYHGMPLRLGNMAVRARNPNTGKIVAQDNRDDAAGFISNITLSRPDYNTGLWLFNPQILNMAGQAAQAPNEFKSKAWPQVLDALLSDLQVGGVWIYHTSWIDIPRKWRMGWHFDNFWSVLSGKQDHYIDKANVKGEFTHTFCPGPDQLENELKRERDRVEIQSLRGSVHQPEVFATVKEWRQKAGL